MGLFDAKYCSICGEKIGLFGTRKLEDGKLCKKCAAKLSPYFSDRRHSTVEEIREQLAYREANQKEVREFHVTRTLGRNTKVLLDDDSHRFMVTSASNYLNANPDILKFSDVTGCNLSIDESKHELKQENEEGKEVSYDPPRYEYSYTFYFTIHVNNPYFNEISFRLNDDTINNRFGIEYKQCEQLAEEIKDALTGIQQAVRAEAAPKKTYTCPGCNAVTKPDKNGNCPYCGTPLE